MSPFKYVLVLLVSFILCSSSAPSIAVADLEILLLHGHDSMNVDDVTLMRDLLQSYPDVSVVDMFDCEDATPTLDTLLAYDAAIVSGYSFADAVAAGDVLADYVDAGGGLILTLYANFPWDTWGLAGRIATEDYYPLIDDSWPDSDASLGDYSTEHPIMAGVSSAWGDRIGGFHLAADAVWAADWDIGEPFIATKGQHVVAVNVFFGFASEWSGDIPLILRNAVLWSLGGTQDIQVYADSIDFGTIFLGESPSAQLAVNNEGWHPLQVSDISADQPVYSAQPASFMVPPQWSQTVMITFTPGAPGGYPATLSIRSDDPDEDPLLISLAGECILPPEIVLSADSLYQSSFTGEIATQSLTLFNTGGSDLSFAIGTDPLDYLGDRGNRAVPEVLVISQEMRPWGGNPAGRFNLLGCQATWIHPVELATTPLDYFDLVYISCAASEAGDDFHVTLSDYADEIEAYVRGGGVLVFVAGTSGASFTLPGGMVSQYWIAPENEVYDPTHPIAIGLPYQLDADPASHDYFEGYLEGQFTFLTMDDFIAEQSTGLTAPLDAGWIVALGAPAEMHLPGGVSYGDHPAMDLLWRNAVSYALFMTGKWVTTAEPGSGIVSAGSSLAVAVTFDAAGLVEWDYLSALMIATNDPDEPLLRVGTHLAVTAAPDIAGAMAPIDFGPVGLGANLRDSLRVLNYGSSPLTVSAVSTDQGDFSASPASFILDPMEFKYIRVDFAPSEVGPAAALLAIASDDPDEDLIQIPLSGIGYDPDSPFLTVAPDELYAELELDQTETQVLLLENWGGLTCHWTASAYPEEVVAGGQEVDWLTVVPEAGVIPSLEERELSILFDATGLLPGDYFARIEIASDDPAHPLITVPVTLRADQTPVLLSRFEILAKPGAVTLIWELAGDEPVALELIASSSDEAWSVDWREEASGIYMAEDSDSRLELGGTFRYALHCLCDGEWRLLRSESVLIPALCFEIALLNAHPNPFNPRTTIPFTLAQKQLVRLAVYDLRGRLVRLMAEAVFNKGRNEVIWQGRDDAGREAPTGIYFVRLEVENHAETRKLIMLR